MLIQNQPLYTLLGVKSHYSAYLGGLGTSIVIIRFKVRSQGIIVMIMQKVIAIIIL